MGVPPASLAPSSKQPTRLRRAFGVGTTAASTIFWGAIAFLSVGIPHHPCVPRSDFNASRFNDLASRSIFSRNEPPNPAKYFSERPEMTSHDGKSRKATRKTKSTKGTKGEITRILETHSGDHAGGYYPSGPPKPVSS
jgi:hypothetical protein